MYVLSCICLIISLVSSSSQLDYVQPDQIEYPGDGYITLFPVFVNLNFTLSKDSVQINQQRFVIYLRRMVYSLFSESTGTPLHLLFLTDDQSKDILMKTLDQEIGRVITRKLLTGYVDESEAQKRWKLPKMKVDLLSLDFFIKNYKDEIERYMEVLCQNGSVTIVEDFVNKQAFQMSWGQNLRLKCEKEYKWVPFILHDVLPSKFKRIILLDVDLRFRSDVSNLYDYFNIMSPTEKVGIAKDWGNMVYETAWYRGRTPRGLQVGEPYPSTQNMNSGVVLLDLEKIRKMNSSSQSSFFNVEKIRSYIKEFNIPTWGDQIIYTLIRWKEKNEVYVLPCVYNYQTLVPKYQIEEDDEPHKFPDCRDCKLADFMFCSGKPQIEHIVHDRELIVYYPLLYSYNKIFKLNTWCDHSQWTHCF